MAAKLTILTHKIAIQLHLVAESCTICSSNSRRPVPKFFDTPSKVTFPRILIFTFSTSFVHSYAAESQRNGGFRHRDKVQITAAVLFSTTLTVVAFVIKHKTFNLYGRSVFLANNAVSFKGSRAAGTCLQDG
jgi:hypothetical protein